MPTISITVTAEQATRAQVAFGKHLNLHDGQGAPRSATSAEIREWIIRRLREVVHVEERAILEAGIVLEPFEPDTAVPPP